MPTWAPVTSNVIDHGFGASRGGAPITGFVVHHGAGPNILHYVANQNSRNSHPTYHIDRHGKVTGIVHPNRRPFSSGSIDVNAVTVEIDNVGRWPDWPVSQASLRSLEALIAHHAVESPREDFAVYNTPGKSQSGFWVAPHSQTASNGTECPGNFVRANLDDVIANANDLIEGEDMPTAKEVSEEVWRGFTFKAINEGKDYGMPAESAAMRLRRAADRSGRAMVLGRRNAADNQAVLAALSTLADSQGLDGDAIVAAVKESVDRAMDNLSITLTNEGVEDE